MHWNSNTTKKLITNYINWASSVSTYLLDIGGTAAAVPPPFRPGNPALCGSHPIVTPYYCRLGDLLCFVFICVLSVLVAVNCG